MSIPVQCPACQHAFAVAEHYLGKRGKCPKCGMIFKATAAPPEEDVPTFTDVSAQPLPQVPAPKRLATLTSKAPPRQLPPPPPVMDAIPAPMAATAELPTFPVVATTNPLAIPAPASEDAPSAAPTKKAPRSALPLIIVGAGGGIALATGAVAALLMMNGSAPEVADAGKNSPPAEHAPVEPASKSAPGAGLPVVDVAKMMPLRGSVLPLEIKTARGLRKANCVVLDSKGLAATSHHLLAAAINVEAIGPAGIRIPVPGTVAIDAAHDLALIKLDPNVPLTFAKLELATSEPAIGAPLVAFDTPTAEAPPLGGRFKASSTIARLAPATRAIVKRVDVAWGDDTLIVMHDLNLPEANNGAPLLNAAGEVVALQLLSSEASGGLALHAKHLSALLAKAGSEVQPWPSPEEVATTDAVPFTTPAEVPALPMPMTEPSDRLPVLPPVKPLGDPVDELIARITEHQAECAKLKWTAKDAREYAQFQLLAQFITDAASLADAPNAAEVGKAKLSDAVTGALASLTAQDFPAEAAWQELGKLAEKGLQTPGEGFFALAKVLIPTSDGQMIGGQPVAVLEIDGTAQLIVVTTTLAGEKFNVESKHVILGMHEAGLRVNIGDRRAAMIRCKYSLLVEKP